MAASVTGAVLALVPGVALAGPDAECSGGACGTPKQSGGGGCGCGGGSILINNTDLGDTYQYADDFEPRVVQQRKLYALSDRVAASEHRARQRRIHHGH